MRRENRERNVFVEIIKLADFLFSNKIIHLCECMLVFVCEFIIYNYLFYHFGKSQEKERFISFIMLRRKKDAIITILLNLTYKYDK